MNDGLTGAEYLELAEELDTMSYDVNTWEAGFLETILKYRRVSEKQKVILDRMADQYLD